MSWIQKLYKTYENCISEVGVKGPGDDTPLLPIAHSTQNAQVEVVINENGEFQRAYIVNKEDAITIIPVTEDSAARGNGNLPHPLCDKLQYVAGDYCKYVDKIKSEEFFDKYFDELQKWCASIYSNRKVLAVAAYLKKKNLVSNLINYKILVCDEKGMLKKGVKIGTVDQADVFIRFRVEIPGVNESTVWLDPEIYDSYVKYYLSKQKETELCYVKGIKIPCSDKHPAKIRNTGDKAKLISANDTSGFTYRGRFSDKSQVVSVGYETSQKAHNALRWLVEKQGYKNGDQVILAWGTNNQNVPDIFEDTMDALFGKDDNNQVTTEKGFAERLNKSIAGYGCDIDTKAEIIIIGLDAATTGRLSITYYQEFGGRDFLERVKKWHSTCSWRHNYKILSDGVDEKGKQKFKNISFIGAPAPRDIAIATYGKDLNDKLKKATILRLLPCITGCSKLPYDIVNSAINRVSNPIGKEKWEWEKALTISCALFKKYRFDKYEEEWSMSLDENQRDRSYLFGRLLAIAQQIEEWALNMAGEKRETNAERMMHQFKIHPYKTWGILNEKLRPYLSRLGSRAMNLTELMTRINAMMPFEEFTSVEKLDDSYILGYYCQRQVFIEEKHQKAEDKAKGVEENKNEGENVNE